MSVAVSLGGASSSIIWVLVGTFVVYQLVSTFTAWYRLRHFPGPPLAAFSYLWLARVALSGKSWAVHMQARERYGKGSHLLRIAPNMLMYDDPAINRHLNSARSRYTRSDWYNPMRFDPYVHTMFSTQDTAYHDDVKAKTAAGYSGKDVPTLESDIDCQVENMKCLIRKKYLSTSEENKPMDFALVAQYFTLDSLTKIAYGEEFGFTATDSDIHGYIKLVEGAMPLFALASDVPWVGSLISSQFMLKSFGPKPTDAGGMGKMIG
jgi:hypothetical protein